jgi:hypothetical protein
MRKEDVTKEFLQEISQDNGYAQGVSVSMMFLFTRKYSHPGTIINPYKGDPVVEPDVFFSRLDEAIKKLPPGVSKDFYISKIALRIKKAILCDLNQVPKYINDLQVGAVARWRLKHGI